MGTFLNIENEVLTLKKHIQLPVWDNSGKIPEASTLSVQESEKRRR